MRRVLLLGVVLAVLAAGSAEARPIFVMTQSYAEQQVRARGAEVERCKRLAPRHIRCWAAFVYERHEAEEEEDGSLVNETVTVLRDPVVCDVGLKGVRVRFY